jgi:hypothetical protein
MAIVGSRKAEAYREFLARFLRENPSVTPFSSADAAEIAEFVVRNAPAETARSWLAELMALAPAPETRVPIGVVALSLAGFFAGAVLIYGIFFRPEFLTSLASADYARGLVTFLFAFATIAVVLITAIATFWVGSDEVEKRGTLAKEILAILIGIMGTILGFYFGSDVGRSQPTSEVSEIPDQ